MQRRETVVNLQSLPLLRHHVTPPGPRRYTSHARQFQDAIGCAAPFVAHYHQSSVVYADIECVLPRDDLLIGQLALLQLLEFLVGERAQLDNLEPALAVGLGALSRHGPHVLAKHLESRFHD